MTLLQIPTMRLATQMRRLGTAGLLLCSTIMGAPAARATGALANACAATGTSPDLVPIASALFTPRRVEEGLAWDARFIVEVYSAVDFRGGALMFAAPLPRGERLLPAQGITPILADDQIVGLCVSRQVIVDKPLPNDRTIAVSFIQPSELRVDSIIPLGAPVIAGTTVQIIETAIGETRLDLTHNEPLEKHVGWVGARTVSAGAREEARRLTDFSARIDRSPLYVRGDDVHGSQGAHRLEARVAGAPARRTGSAIGISVLFAGLVTALVFAARKLRQNASIEHADALLAAEIDQASERPTR